MSMLRSQINLHPESWNGVQLGDPIIVTASGTPAGPGDSILDCFWGWDHESFAPGVLSLDANGDLQFTPDTPAL